MAGRNLEVANEAFAVTKSDTADNYGKYFYVGTGGDLAVVPTGNAGVAVTIPAVPAGSWVWCACSKIMSTNTTASGIVGFR